MDSRTFLLSKGVDPYVTTSLGQTAESMAMKADKEGSHRAVLRIFERIATDDSTQQDGSGLGPSPLSSLETLLQEPVRTIYM